MSQIRARFGFNGQLGVLATSTAALAWSFGCTPATTGGDSNLASVEAGGAQGPVGPQGEAGIDCWDTNGNGVNDPSEDTNGDGVFDSRDCQGAVASGALILSDSATPPSGFTFTGLSMPAGDAWRTRNLSPIPRAAAGVATLPDGIYVAGGTDPNGQQPIADVSRYDPNADTWTAIPGMPTARLLSAAGAVEGKMIVAGGRDPNGTIAVVEAYTPATNAWTTVAPMLKPTESAMSGAVGDKLFVIGGFDPNNVLQNDVQIYDASTNTWSAGQPMPTARALGYAGVIGTKIFVAGGTDNTKIFDAFEVYDTVSNTWTTLTPMPHPLALGASTALDGRLYVIGGADSTAPNVSLVDLLLAYDPASNTWTTGAQPVGSALVGNATVEGDRMFLIGGIVLAGKSTRDIEAYTPPTTLFVMQKN